MSLCPENVLITGANRGIGLEFVKQFAALPRPPAHVFAGCRTPDQAKELKELAEKNKTIIVIHIDLNDLQSIKKSASVVQGIVGEKGLNMIVNNAGVVHPSGIDDVTSEIMMNLYTVNAIGPLMVAQTFLPLMKAAAASQQSSTLSSSKAAIINISTGVASIADNSSGGIYAYRCSKAALNMLTKSLSVDLKKFGILATAILPGFVDTDMTGRIVSDKKISVQDSVGGMMKVISKDNGDELNGKYYSYTGKEFPW